MKVEVGGTLEVMLIDRSTSMRKFDETTTRAFDTHIKDLQEAPGSELIWVCAGTFSGGGVSILFPPTRVADICQGLRRAPYAGGTPLYTAVAFLLQQLLDASEGASTTVVFNVLTDGEDRGSQPGDLARLRTALVPAAIERGYRLAVIGIGVDGPQIARITGFPTGDAAAEPATDAGVERSFVRATLVTTRSGLR